jgi:nickel/cobalt transporter (NicO) family protein
MTLGVGVLLGARHAVDADHLVVVATMIERERGLGGALRTAVLWSAGHSCTFFGLGLGIVALGLRIPDSFERATELAIAFMLIGLGLWHWRTSSIATDEKAKPPSQLTVRPIAAGILHGLAGSAGIALLALTTIPTAMGAVLYLVAFGVGTVLGMMASTALLSLPLRLSRRICHGKSRVLTALASGASIGLGLVLVWQSFQKN